MLPGDRVNRWQPDAASREHHRLLVRHPVNFARLPQRAGDTSQLVADLELVDPPSAGAHTLDDQDDRPGVRVPVGQGQRDQFALRLTQHPDELPGSGRTGDQRGVNLQLDDARPQLTSSGDDVGRPGQFAEPLGP